MGVLVMQLTLGLGLRDDATFANFVPGDNLYLLNYLQEFVQHQGELFIYLWGAMGSGRTHLLQACCHAAPANQSIYLDLADPQLEPAVLTSLENFSLVCLDNIEAVVGQREWELDLFNLYNALREREFRLLIAALAPPTRLSCQLPDLCSRLSWGLVLNLRSLTHEQKLQVLQMRAKRRGLVLSTAVGNFLLHHYSREINHLISILEILDKEAMAAKHRLTIPFVKQVLRVMPAQPQPTVGSVHKSSGNDEWIPPAQAGAALK